MCAIGSPKNVSYASSTIMSVCMRTLSSVNGISGNGRALIGAIVAEVVAVDIDVDDVSIGGDGARSERDSDSDLLSDPPPDIDDDDDELTLGWPATPDVLLVCVMCPSASLDVSMGQPPCIESSDCNVEKTMIFI